MTVVFRIFGLLLVLASTEELFFFLCRSGKSRASESPIRYLLLSVSAFTAGTGRRLRVPSDPFSAAQRRSGFEGK